MNEDLLGNLIAVGVGWALAEATQALARTRSKSLERKRLFGRLNRILEGALLELKIEPALKNAGAIQTLSGIFDFDESWTKLIPHRPPSVPNDLGSVIETVSNWEVEREKDALTKQLIALKKHLEFATTLFQGMEVFAQNGKAPPNRSLKVYQMQLTMIQDTLQASFRESKRLRNAGLLQWAKRKWK